MEKFRLATWKSNNNGRLPTFGESEGTKKILHGFCFLALGLPFVGTNNSGVGGPNNMKNNVYFFLLFFFYNYLLRKKVF